MLGWMAHENRWAWPRTWRRALVVALGVGGAVSLGHELVPTGSWWPAVHGCLPALVYAAGVRAAGTRVNTAIVARGLVVVVLVAFAFSAVNDDGSLPLAVRIGLNFLIPFVVSILGSLSGGRAKA